MRSLVVVAWSPDRALNRFHQSSLGEARNLRDFLEETGDYESVAIYELEKSDGPLTQWAELQESSR